MLTIQDLTSFMASYDTIKDEKMPLSLAYKLNKILTYVKADIKFYNERYNSYLSLYAEPDPNGGYKLNADKSGVILKQEYIQEAHEKFNELDEWTFPDEMPVEKITLSELEGISVSPATLSGLFPFIENK